MTARARLVKGRVAMQVGSRRMLVSFDDAAELLAELEVMFKQHQGDWYEYVGEENFSENRGCR